MDHYFILVLFAISVGVPLVFTASAAVFLTVVVRTFPTGSRGRRVAAVVAVLAVAGCSAYVLAVTYEAYRPVIEGESAATNGLILLLGPTYLSSRALVGAMVVGVLLLFLSLWARRGKKGAVKNTNCTP